MFQKQFIAQLILLAISAHSFAQSFTKGLQQKVALAKTYTISDGLPSNEIYQTIQDKNGIIWFCTDKGVVRFNGSDFKTFNIRDGLPENAVTKANKAYDGNLWFLTKNDGIFYIDNVPKNFFIKKRLSESGFNINKLKIRDYYFARDTLHILSSKPWAKTYHLCITKKSVQVNEINNDSSSLILIKLYGQTISCINYAFKGCHGSTLIKKGRYTYISNTKHEQWYSSTQRLIGAWRHNTNALPYYSIENKVFKTNDTTYEYELGSTVNALLRHKNRLYISTPNGLIEKELDQNIQRAFYKGFRPSHFFIDIDGHIWISLLNAGVSFIQKSPFSVLKNSKKPNISYSTMCHRNKWILLGHKNSQVTVINKLKGIDTTLTIKSPPEPVLQIENLNKNLFIITFSGTTYTINCTELQSQELNANFLFNYLSPYGKDSFIGVRNITSSITKFSRDLQLKFRSYDAEKKSNPIKHRSNTIHYDSLNERAFIATTQGVYEYKPKPNITSSSFEYEILDSTSVSCISQYKASYAFGTNGHGIYLNSKNYTGWITDQLSFTDINKVAFLKPDLLAAGTNLGLYIIGLKKDSFSILSFINESRGLLGNKVAGITKINEGAFYVLTEKALLKINVAEAIKKKNQRVSFNNFNLNNRKVYNDSITVNFDSSQVIANFISLNYTSSNTLYGYKVEPINNNWAFTKEKSVDLSGIRPGKYTIKFAAFDTYNKKPTSKIISVTLLVEKPYYLTKAFIGLSILLGILLVSSIIIFIVRRIKQQARIQNQLVELEAQALRTQMNPHFFFNTLNSIQSFIALNDKKQAFSYISKFAKLVRTYLNQTNLKDVRLADELVTLESYIELEKMRLDHAFEYSIEIDDQVSLKLSQLTLPAMLVQPVVENAIMHGIRNLDTKGLLHIKVTDKGAYYIIEIRDNGIGLKKAQDLTQHKKRHSSLGLRNISRRVNLLRSSTNNSIDFSIAELKYPDKGTIAIFKFSYAKYEQ